MTQLDIEGLQAAVLRDHGFGGPEAGFATAWVKERGTVSISAARAEFLESLWPGRLVIHRTSMVGGKVAPGEWQPAAKGNFFGKGRLEAFMGALDHLTHTLRGQTGRHYSAQPATLGDTTLTLQAVINAAKRERLKSSGSLVEESILTAAMNRLLARIEIAGALSAAEEDANAAAHGDAIAAAHGDAIGASAVEAASVLYSGAGDAVRDEAAHASSSAATSAPGEPLNAYQASLHTGIKPPLLHFSEFVAVLGAIFQRHNQRRDHRMQGFEKIAVPHANNGGLVWVHESPNEKAARLARIMELQGRRLSRPSDQDIALLLHKVKRVVGRSNGVVLSHGAENIRYFHEGSRACAAASSIMAAQKTFLALYNPVAPDALYLLQNPPGHLPASCAALPADFRPQLFEILPRYEAPSPVDPAAMRRRAAQVQAYNNQFMRAAAAAAEPILIERTEQREKLQDRLEPLRAVIMSAPPAASAGPAELPTSELAAALAEESAASASELPCPRSAQRDEARAALVESLGGPAEIAASLEDET
jgi:hypothetical protein